jgi:hypothetical protein
MALILRLEAKMGYATVPLVLERKGVDIIAAVSAAHDNPECISDSQLNKAGTPSPRGKIASVDPKPR